MSEDIAKEDHPTTFFDDHETFEVDFPENWIPEIKQGEIILHRKGSLRKEFEEKFKGQYENYGTKINLKGWQKQVEELAKTKGFDQELFYMFGHMIQEAGEFLAAVWENKSVDDIEEEGADILHFLFQMASKNPKVDLDRGMERKIASNYVSKKKTKAEDGSMIRK